MVSSAALLHLEAFVTESSPEILSKKNSSTLPPLRPQLAHVADEAQNFRRVLNGLPVEEGVNLHPPFPTDNVFTQQ